MKLKELAQRLGADATGPADVEITGAAGVAEAGPAQITYITGDKYFAALEKTGASAAIVPLDTPDMPLPVLRVKNPRYSFALALGILYGKPYAPRGISDRAVVGRNVEIGKEPSIHPYAVVADGAQIGSRVTLYPGVCVGEGSVIGDECLIYPNVSIREGVTIGSRVIIHSGAVIGSDGFGFVTEGGRHHKIPQVGGVIIEDDVEIGANCTIDRAMLGNTIIRKGTKLDNMIQIAHNVIVGEHCLFAAQVVIGGSATIGNYVVFGGQVAVADHITISDRVMAGGQSGILKDPGPGQVVSGTYAVPIRDWLKMQAVFPKLPELKKQVSELEKQLRELQKQQKE